METVRVRLKKRTDDSYPIYIGPSISKSICNDLKKKKIGNRYLIISDSIAGSLFGNLLNSLRESGIKADILAFPAGEHNKNLNTYAELMEGASRLGLDRKSAIIALGGGVAGDVAGFVAATYMRGINFVQVPTTLLAMVDSSIGGKVGVDLKHLKNAAGAFHQPKAVYMDIEYLNSLPQREMGCGIAEIIKHAVIADPKLFSYLEKNIDKVVKKDRKALIRAIKRSCEIKGSIVEKDEKEHNLRVIVNYGHTIGHAIEEVTSYRKYLHGEAIAIGMNVAARVSHHLGFMPADDVRRQEKLLAKANLQVRFPNIHPAIIINELHKDKKSFADEIVFTLPGKIGKMKQINGSYRIKVDKAIIRKAIEECR